MKLLRIVCIIISLTLAILITSADAKWWIFGASEDQVETSYLFLNKVSFSELGTKVTLYRSMLPNGMVMVQGRALAGQNKIGSVRITLDAKVSWVDAKLSENGAFEYGFTPEMGKTYKLYVEVTDTRGKTNKIEDTYKEIVVSDMNIQSLVREAMNKLIETYQNENAGRFMALVAEDYAADKTILDRAIRKDFRDFDNLVVRYTLNNVTAAAGGKVFVVFSYAQQVTSVRTGKTSQGRGTTQFTFKFGDKGLNLWDMKVPLIFGWADPRDVQNVATGVTNTAMSDTILVSDGQGNISSVPISVAVQQFQSGTSSETGSVELRCSEGDLGFTCQGFTFATGDVGPSNPSQDLQLFADFGGSGLFFKQMPQPTRSKELIGVSIDSLSGVPADVPGAGYADTFEFFNLPNFVGRTFALHLSTGKYAAIYFQSFVQGAPPSPAVLRLRYKYQPNGTPMF